MRALAEVEGLPKKNPPVSSSAICSSTTTHNCELLLGSAAASSLTASAVPKQKKTPSIMRWQVCSGAVIKTDPISLENLRPSPHPKSFVSEL